MAFNPMGDVGRLVNDLGEMMEITKEATKNAALTAEHVAQTVILLEQILLELKILNNQTSNHYAVAQMRKDEKSRM